MFKPMLAATLKDVEALWSRFPLFVSPKLDGIRAIVRDGQLYSRNLKLIPNEYVQKAFRGLPDLDGELIVGSPTAKNVFNATSSGVMCQDKSCEATFHVFDIVSEQHRAAPFVERLERAQKLVRRVIVTKGSNVVIVPHKLIYDIQELLEYERIATEMGYEGVMLRSHDGPYKYGRATEREGYLLKLKRFVDAEAVVIGHTEQMSNRNEQTTDELGRAKRSSHKAGKVATGMLGNLVVRDLRTGVEFEVGTGFTEVQRQQLWQQRESLPGRLVKYRYFPVGVKDKPRFPVFLGFRHVNDL